jgi:hypothetical protein
VLGSPVHPFIRIQLPVRFAPWLKNAFVYLVFAADHRLSFQVSGFRFSAFACTTSALRTSHFRTHLLPVVATLLPEVLPL